jgi:hypothetical protein
MPQCHNMHSAAETTTLKSPNCFSPETNETKHNRKIPITTTVTFFGSLSLGPFLLLYPLCHGSCHTSALIRPRHPLARATKDTKNDSCAAARTARARARRRRGADADAIASNQHGCGDDGDSHIFYFGPAMVPSMVPSMAHGPAALAWL